MSYFSPVVLFVYNRLDHTKKTVLNLINNKYSENTCLYIYSDASRNVNDIDEVNEVRKFIREIKGFKSVTIIENEHNKGLASNIISGVTDVIKKHGKAIVLEDDIVVSPFFLEYMNNCLDKYIDNKKVWQISSYSYPPMSDMNNSKCLLSFTNCWGWATWEDRWKYFKREPEVLIKKFSREDIYKFDLNNSFDFWRQVKSNYSGRTKTWAVFWYATVFRKQGLTVFPRVIYSENIGFDGSGEHCVRGDVVSRLTSNEAPDDYYPTKVDSEMMESMRLFFKSEKLSFISLVKRKLLRTLKK